MIYYLRQGTGLHGYVANVPVKLLVDTVQDSPTRNGMVNGTGHDAHGAADGVSLTPTWDRAHVRVTAR